MTHFWAKTNRDGLVGISVYHHMINVGCVARCLAEMSPELIRRFNLQAASVGAVAALHDVGKISPGFQRKCEVWLKENSLVDIDRNGCWDTGMEPNHGKVSHSAIQKFLTNSGFNRQTAKYVSTVIGGHHGSLSPPDDRGYKPAKAISEVHSKIDWEIERQTQAKNIWDSFVENDSNFALSDDSPSLWWLAGLTTVSDWLGSDERFFSPERREFDIDAASIAKEAIAAIGFHRNQLIAGLTFHDLFHDKEKPWIKWCPNEMQEKTFAAINKPGVYVIEAPMGMGKTEAALWAAYELLIHGHAQGIYFALPTQATSNRIHLRVADFLSRISPVATPRLIHSNSWLLSGSVGIDPAATDGKVSSSDDARVGKDWFASTKRALLAQFGVGTVDQALLGVVAAKHFFVRHFALAGKVVILDEIHSYDLYTGTLIDKLITTLEGLGCTVIILSATLTGKRREQITKGKNNSPNEVEQPYPLITGRAEGVPLDPVSVTPPSSRGIKVDFVGVDDATNDAINLAKKGGAVLWICNTVDAAQKQYRRLSDQIADEFPIGLLHSRFPFWRREVLETEWMERFGKDSTTRCGSILVSTQVVEQSVDLDADLLISELAPTDMLLQRLGRLWRHERSTRPIDVARLCILNENKSLNDLRVMNSKEIEDSLGNKARVYAPYILLRSLEVWQAQQLVIIPAQIRTLIESTYKIQDSEPESWQKLNNDWFGTGSAKKLLAARNCNLWQVALEDEEGVQTRLNEMPTIALILCKSLTEMEAIFVDLSKGVFGGDQYQFSTAQAIHRNVVKVPEYCFDRIVAHPDFTDYVRGAQTVGIVADSGDVEVTGLKSGIRFFYSDEQGLVIGKESNAGVI